MSLFFIRRSLIVFSILSFVFVSSGVEAQRPKDSPLPQVIQKVPEKGETPKEGQKSKESALLKRIQNFIKESLIPQGWDWLGWRVVCGNGIVEAGEECEGTPNCNTQCQCSNSAPLHPSNLCPNWTRTIGTEWLKAETGDITLDGKENIYVTLSIMGTESSPTIEGRNIVVAKYDRCGYQRWLRVINNNFHDTGEVITADTKGNVYIAGAISSEMVDKNIIIRKYNTCGDELWTQYFGETAPEPAIDEGSAGGAVEGQFYFNEWVYGITLGPDGYVYVLGTAHLQQPDGSYGLAHWLGKYSQFDGSVAGSPWPIIELPESGESSGAPAKGIALDGSGDIYFARNGSMEFAANESFTLWKYSSEVTSDSISGSNVIAVYNVPDAVYPFIHVNNLIFGGDGNIYLVGSRKTLLSGARTLWVGKFDPTGIFAGVPFPFDDPYFVGVDITLDTDGNSYVTGKAQLPVDAGSFLNLPFLRKYNSSGEIIWNQGWSDLPSPTNPSDLSSSVGIARSPDGHIYILGTSIGIDPKYYWIRKFTPSN